MLISPPEVNVAPLTIDPVAPLDSVRAPPASIVVPETTLVANVTSPEAAIFALVKASVALPAIKDLTSVSAAG
jgi:hypothetical protein